MKFKKKHAVKMRPKNTQTSQDNQCFFCTRKCYNNEGDNTTVGHKDVLFVGFRRSKCLILLCSHFAHACVFAHHYAGIVSTAFDTITVQLQTGLHNVDCFK